MKKMKLIWFKTLKEYFEVLNYMKSKGKKKKKGAVKKLIIS